jgi:hypothetical protein
MRRLIFVFVAILPLIGTPVQAQETRIARAFACTHSVDVWWHENDRERRLLEAYRPRHQKEFAHGATETRTESAAAGSEREAGAGQAADGWEDRPETDRPKALTAVVSSSTN